MRRNIQANYNPGIQPIAQHLNDLDRELQLLKRKREMYEQQQQQLMHGGLYSAQGQFNVEQQAPNYNQPFYAQGSSFNTNNFAQLYDNVQQPKSNNYGKRNTDNVWQPNNAKRFKGPARPALLNRPEPFGNTATRAHSTFPSARFNAPPKNPPKTFKPAMVTKQVFTPKPKPANPVNTSTAPLSNTMADMVLHPDKVPTRQMTGRLEFALGVLVKELRTQYSDPTNSSLLKTQGRLIKQTIRDRIRTVMLGKIVGTADDIVKIYRRKFPKKTDSRILASARTAQKEIPTRATAEHYFKYHMKNVLESNLKAMLDKLRQFYEEENKSKGFVVPDDITSDIFDSSTEDIAKSNTEEVTKDSTTNDNTKDTTAEVDVAENSTEIKVDDVIIVEDTKPDPVTEGDVVNLDNVPEVDKVDLTEKKKKNREFHKEILERLLPVYLPQALLDLKPKILEVLHFKQSFVLDKLKYQRKALNRVSRDTADLMSEVKQADDSNTVTCTPMSSDKPVVTEETSENTNKKTIYYVKVIGRPKLPEKSLMADFLNSFHSVSIKKHKSIHNLLFVGFSDPNDYENILAANDSIIGGNKIAVRASGQSNPPPKVDNSNAELSAELDNQITELLTSIRKAEEEDTLAEVSNIESETVTDEIKGNNTDAANENIADILSENKLLEDPKENEDVNETENTDGNMEDPNKTLELEEITALDEPAAETETAITDNNENPVKVTDGDNNDNIEETSAENAEVSDVVNPNIETVKTAVRATPTRSSNRLANANITPSTITTRRTSKLAQN